MAKAADYGLGPNTFPRGWFIVAESKELDDGPMAVRFFGQDFALYRGESGKPVMLDAYCAHMGTHLTASTSAMIVKNGEQIEGDSIRCPYHGWRYDADDDMVGQWCAGVRRGGDRWTVEIAVPFAPARPVRPIRWT